MISQINFINDLLWGSVLIYLLIGIGLYFTYRLNFIQFRYFKHMFAVMRNSRKSDASGISSFQALCTTLAARVGSGNMAGVAVALTLGGPGAIFWMWLIAMLGMATAFAESALAQLYKIRDDEGNYRGGPAYYMERGLGMRWMGVIFSICLIIAFGSVFNAVQANSISQATYVAFGWQPHYIGFGLVVLTGLIIFGGLRTIARTAEILVPAMALCYLALALFIMFSNIEQLPHILMLIFRSAFGFEEAASGALGYTIAQGMINGLKRGLFSNEAGMGSAPNAAASATPYPPHPASQGYVQMLGVFIDTIVICSATVAIILMSGEYEPHSSITGIELTQKAISSQVGDWGGIFIAIAIFFFSFTSLIANYSYAETNLIFLKHNDKLSVNIFRIIVLCMVMFGAMADLPTVWAMADISMAMMAMINLAAIVLLSGTVVKLAQDYNKQLGLGKIPIFDCHEYPELHAQLDAGVWDQTSPLAVKPSVH